MTLLSITHSPTTPMCTASGQQFQHHEMETTHVCMSPSLAIQDSSYHTGYGT